MKIADMGYICHRKRRRVRVVEGARLESVYTSKAYREFESLRLRQKIKCPVGAFFMQKLQYAACLKSVTAEFNLAYLFF